LQRSFLAPHPRHCSNTGSSPDLLEKWWPPEVEPTPEKGGKYQLSWPNQNWHLRGTFTEFVRGKELGFTWKWDHERVEPVLVRLNFEPTRSGGTKLILQHGAYPANPEGKKIRDEHIEGWMYFLGKLR